MADLSAATPSQTAGAGLRRDAERAAQASPALMAEARRLASTIVLGAHGRRRPGVGETFWQYRRAGPGDAASAIDWRRSARSDALFVRETEWEAAQTVWLWCDRSASMAYRSRGVETDKRRRAQVLTAAIAILLNRGGERISVLGARDARPSFGAAHLARSVSEIARPEPDADYGRVAIPPFMRGGRAVFISDFFGEEAELTRAVREAAARGVKGLLLQVVDPAEESFPFDGRVVFESMRGVLRYETDRAAAIRDDYARALAARRERLTEAASAAGWRWSVHRTNESAAPALLWAAQALSQPVAGGGGGGF